MKETLRFVVVHIDGTVTLVEQKETERVFVPMETMSELRNWLNDEGADVEIRNIINETERETWMEVLDCVAGCVNNATDRNFVGNATDRTFVGEGRRAAV